MKQIGIFPNFKKVNTAKITTETIKWLKNKGINVYLPRIAVEILGFPQYQNLLERSKDILDMVIVFGGDGTLLRVARELAPKEIPILGVNFGHLGFLTELEIPELFSGLEKIIEGHYRIENRMMLKTSLPKNNLKERQFYALNDIVITKGSFARLIRLETYVGTEYIETYPADGLIISSPTGSTAYSLSAGGPIVNPNLNLLLITPICPHSLHARPLVISEHEEVKVIIRADHQDIMLTLDGQQGLKLQPNEEVIVSKADFNTKLIRLKNRSFYEILREKLAEGGHKEF